MNTLSPAPGATLARTILLIFSIPWTACSCLFLLAPLGTWLISSPDLSDLPAMVSVGASALFSLPFLAVGLGLFAFGVWPFVIGLRAAKPEITISRREVRVGDSFVIGYSQAFRRTTQVSQASVSLIFRETAKYRRGTNTYTEHDEKRFAEFELPGGIFEGGQVFTFSHQFFIPPDGMHSFSASNNLLEWLVRVKVEIAGWPDYREDFVVQVVPELA